MSFRFQVIFLYSEMNCIRFWCPTRFSLCSVYSYDYMIFHVQIFLSCLFTWSDKSAARSPPLPGLSFPCMKLWFFCEDFVWWVLLQVHSSNPPRPLHPSSGGGRKKFKVWRSRIVERLIFKLKVIFQIALYLPLVLDLALYLPFWFMIALQSSLVQSLIRWPPAAGRRCRELSLLLACHRALASLDAATPHATWESQPRRFVFRSGFPRGRAFHHGDEESHRVEVELDGGKGCLLPAH